MSNPTKAMLIAAAFAVATFRPAAAQDTPNLIWIMADDLGYGELGSYGQTVISTPQLDRMAKEGLRFTQFYAGATVCAPSRSVLMTGQHHGHTRVRGNAGSANPIAQALRAEDTTVAKVLQQAGYHTALIGKWGLGDVGAADSGLPRKQGFDEFLGYLNQHHAHKHFPDYLWRNEDKVSLTANDARRGNPRKLPSRPAEGRRHRRQRFQLVHEMFSAMANPGLGRRGWPRDCIKW
jgi:arylsulfatase A-like enzyme